MENENKQLIRIPAPSTRNNDQEIKPGHPRYRAREPEMVRIDSKIFQPIPARYTEAMKILDQIQQLQIRGFSAEYIELELRNLGYSIEWSSYYRRTDILQQMCNIRKSQYLIRNQQWHDFTIYRRRMFAQWNNILAVNHEIMEHKRLWEKRKERNRQVQEYIRNNREPSIVQSGRNKTLMI